MCVDQGVTRRVSASEAAQKPPIANKYLRTIASALEILSYPIAMQAVIEGTTCYHSISTSGAQV
jgi:hypothetical protein